MTLEQRVNDDIKQAMLAKQPERLAALRAVKAAILLEKTSGTAHELTDADVVKLMQKLVKQRRESAELYTSAGRAELAANELAEAGIIEEYLPKQLSAAELEAALRDIIAQTGAVSPADMGESDGSGDQEAGRPGGWQGDIRGCQEAAELRPGCGRYRSPSFRRRCSGWRQP